MMPPTTPMMFQTTLETMNTAELSGIVSRTLGKPVTVTDCQATLLGGLDSSPVAGGVYEVSGTATSAGSGQAVTTDDIAHNWRIVAKRLCSPAGFPLPDGTTLGREWAENQSGFLYWRREALAADSELLTNLPAGLTAPRWLGTTRISDEELWLWQELVPSNPAWAWADYSEAAYRLGQWQGETLTSQLLSDQSCSNFPWLSQNWLAGWTDGALTFIYDMIAGMNGWQHPLLTGHFTADELAQLPQLWEERHALLAHLAAQPQTLCHLDAYRANMVWQDNELLLLDWANVGQAALGEEMAAFVGAALWFNHVPLAEAERLETAVFAGYLAGLRAGGWDGEAAHVWQAYRCHMPLRYALNSVFNMLRTAVEPGFAEEWEQKTNQPLADILCHEADFVRFLLTQHSMAMEAV